MGLAASQARKQLLTARINNLELQIQMTNNMKIRYSMEKQALSKSYYKALTNTIGGYRDDRDNVQDLSFENLTRSLSIGNGKFSTMRFVNAGGFEVVRTIPTGYSDLSSKTVKKGNTNVSVATMISQIKNGTAQENEFDVSDTFPQELLGNILASDLSKLYIKDEETIISKDENLNNYSQAQLISMINNGALGIEHCSDYNKDLEGNIFSSVTLEEIGNDENETLRMTTFETILDKKKNNYETELTAAQTEMDDLNNFIKNAIEKGFKVQIG